MVPAAWVAGPRKVDHWRTLLRARAIENTVVRRRASASPARATAATRWSSDPLGDVLAEAGDGAEMLAADARPATVLAEARRTNPSLANRRL